MQQWNDASWAYDYASKHRCKVESVHNIKIANNTNDKHKKNANTIFLKHTEGDDDDALQNIQTH